MDNYYKYFKAGDFEKEWGMYIVSAGYSKTEPGVKYSDKDHPEDHWFSWNGGRVLDGYALGYISKGQGIFESKETGIHTIEEGTAFILFPGVWHRYESNINTGWEEYWVGFRGTYPDHLISKFFSPSNPFIPIGYNKSFINLFMQIVDTLKSLPPAHHQIIAGMTIQLLGISHAAQIKTDQSEKEIKLIIDKAKFFIQENVQLTINFEELAEELNTGYSWFRRMFKHYTGLAPAEYQLQLRINKSKELLSTTSRSIGTIANDIGYDSGFYFSRLFKKKTGLSPKDFRIKSKTYLKKFIGIDESLAKNE